MLLFKQYIATMVLERWVMSFDLHLYLILSMYNQMGGYTLKKTWFEAFVYFIIKKMEHIKLKFWRVFIKRVHCLWLSNLSVFIWVILKANFFFLEHNFQSFHQMLTNMWILLYWTRTPPLQSLSKLLCVSDLLLIKITTIEKTCTSSYWM